jgi:purine-binding chemotaxis protein CheW
MAASRVGSGLAELLVCRVGGKVCGIALPHVIETMRPLPVEPLAHLPESMLGLSMIRGRPTPVLDGRRLLGGSSPSPARRFVSLRLGQDRKIALAVDDVIGVRQVLLSALRELPALVGDQGSSAVSRLGALDQELLVVLEHARILPDAVWRLLEEGAGP